MPRYSEWKLPWECRETNIPWVQPFFTCESATLANFLLTFSGYMVAQPAWSYLLGRWHAGKVLGISAFAWGIMVLVMVWSQNFTHVMVTRFFLGVFEAAVTPGRE